MRSFLKQSVPGVTIIEVIVASTLLISALAASVSMVGSATLQIADNRNRLTATYLVQECLELSRNARDSAAVQTIWHCPFFDIDDVTSNDWSAQRSIGVSEINDTQGAISCYDGGVFDAFGVQVAPIADALSTIELNGTEYTRTLTIKDVDVVEQPTLSGTGTFQQAQQMTLQCDVRWTNRGTEKAVAAAQTLTRWRR